VEAMLPRRSFLKLAGAGLAPLGLGSLGFDSRDRSQEPSSKAALITRQKEPENLESPFSALKGDITPNEQFYVRTHFATPRLNTADWHLTVEGSVDRPLVLTYDDLLGMGRHTVKATLECAGNSRVYLTPPARGVQWEQGAVSTAEWTGVPLSAILERAGLRHDCVELVFEGADSGEIKDPPHPGAALNFSRSLPLKKALEANVLVAYEMNGQPLPRAHGHPARVIVPGWYAVASVKWLKRIVAVTTPYHGYFQTIDYAYWRHENGFVERVPLTELQVKSQIARPVFREQISAGSTYQVTGAAWSGESGISQVDVSVDGGKTWNPTRLLGESKAGIWRLWNYNWQAPSTPGNATLMSRATDNAGNVQPMTRDLDRENYMINQVIPIEVEVR